MNRLRFPAFRQLAVLAMLGLFLIAAAPDGLAQTTVYARFLDGTGIWAGESTDPGRTGWSKLASVSFGASRSVTLSSSGNAAFDSVVLTKNVDRLTPQIFAVLASATPLNGGTGNPDVTIEFVKTGAAGPVTFFRVELRLAFFSEQKTVSVEGEDALLENCKLINAAFRYTYWPILANGSQGTAVVKSWSVLNNNATFTP